MSKEWKCANFSSISARSVCVSTGLRALEREKRLNNESDSFVIRLSVVSWDLIYYLWNEAWHFSPCEVWINILWSICLSFLSGLFLMETVITGFALLLTVLRIGFSTCLFGVCRMKAGIWKLRPGHIRHTCPTVRRAVFCHQRLGFILPCKQPFNLIYSLFKTNSFLELLKILWPQMLFLFFS